jgi:hypothetical protein
MSPRSTGTSCSSSAGTTAAAISFDGETIRKDGLFVVDDLVGLNPDALKG